MTGSSVPEYRQALWDSRLGKLFDGEDREQVLSWLLEVGERKRVIVVGAGFSKNAHPEPGNVPDWGELTKRMARHLRIHPEEGHDPLELADLFETEHSRDALEAWLAEQLDDDALVPGVAHRALWESSPQAVITTNFLDTALEKPISSVGVPVYECTQLAKRLSDVQRHLIYFHGHRSAPETWVTSRRDYEDLPRKRPAIHIKVRQLLAEFPAVVVGYSMRDPDFHQIYRETARVLDDRHPPGLVVLPVQDEDRRLSQMRAEYWKALRVRFVHFRKDVDDLNAAYEAFFRLVELPDSYDALRSALVAAEGSTSCAKAFERNLRIAESALRDVWHDRFRARDSDRFWKDALRLALPKVAKERAETLRSESWHHDIEQRTKRSRRSGVSGGPEQEPRANAPEPFDLHPLDIVDWIPAGDTPSDAQEQLLKELELDDEVVRMVEQALRARADRGDICTWLRRFLDNDYMAPSHGEAVVRRMLALLTGSEPDPATKGVGSRRHVEPADLADPQEPPPQHHLVALLIKARDEALSENGDLARESYLRIAKELGRDGLLRQDLSLPAYFAVGGAIAYHRWDQEAPPELSRQKQALESTVPIRVWRERVRSAKEAVLKARTGRDGFRTQRDGYESRGWSFSTSPSELWREFTYARDLGAPLYVLYDLQVPLLGTFPSSSVELSQRLSYNLENPGEWLKRELEDRMFQPERAGPFGVPLRTKREEIQRSIDRCLYPDGTAREGLAGRACLSVLAHCPEVTLQEHVQVAIDQLVSRDESGDERLLASAWTGISEVCSWADVRLHLIRYVEGRERRDFRWRNLVTRLRQFPWRDWIVRDDFFNAGGRDFVSLLIGADEDPLNDQVGWLLHRLRFVDPNNEFVLSLSASWLAQPITTEDERRFDAVCALLATFDGCPEELTGVWSQVRAVVEEADCSKLDLVAHLAKSKHDTELRRLARKKLRALGDECVTSIELDVLAASSDAGPLSEGAQRRVLQVLGASWQQLPFVAELLPESRWSSENWAKLVTLIEFGDDGRARNEWRLQKIRLVLQALSIGGEPLKHMLSQARPFRNVREGVPRAVVEGDQETATDAMWVIPNLFLATSEREEQLALLQAVEVASRDQRVPIAAEAAFTTAFLLTQSNLSEEHRARLDALRASLETDPCAAIRRQLDVGAAVGDVRAGARAGQGV